MKLISIILLLFSINAYAEDPNLAKCPYPTEGGISALGHKRQCEVESNNAYLLQDRHFDGRTTSYQAQAESKQPKRGNGQNLEGN
jgi:hypothetical protein